jgi:hypothetical protein
MFYSKDKRQSQENRDEVVQKKYREEKIEDFSEPSRRALISTQPAIQWVPGFFTRGKKRWDHVVNQPPHIGPRLKKE